MLARLDPFFERDAFAEMQEPADLVSQLRQFFVID